MLRTPACATERLPVCYGLSHDAARALCRACPVIEACRRECQTWGSFRSLSEVCAEAEAEVASLSVDRASIERIYDREYERHFGRRSPRKSTLANDTVFGRILSMKFAEGVDPATFIAANMATLRDFVVDTPYGFQPNMLSGEKARGRYNAFLRRSNRRFHRGLGDVAESTSALGVFRHQLLLDEQEVGELFVRSAWADLPLLWEEAVERTEPSDLWRSIESRSGLDYREWCGGLGIEAVHREKRLSLLRAGVNVANGFRTGLADQIGVQETFSWSALAEIVSRTFDRPEAEAADLTDVPGQMWGH